MVVAKQPLAIVVCPNFIGAFVSGGWYLYQIRAGPISEVVLLACYIDTRRVLSVLACPGT